MRDPKQEDTTAVRDAMPLCSECFNDRGLRFNADRLGPRDGAPCQRCGSTAGAKLSDAAVQELARRFFVVGTTVRGLYGGAPRVVSNPQRETEITAGPGLDADIRLLTDTLRVGFFNYGPRLWMVGEVEPLKKLQDPDTRAGIVDRIVSEYPRAEFGDGDLFYRLRMNPQRPESHDEYDSPPDDRVGHGRLDSAGLPVLYASKDLQLCVHECRVSIEDSEVFVASLQPRTSVKLLDLSGILPEQGTEFESLDMAVHMIFLAGRHSYEITRAIGAAAHCRGYDGVVYPSFFSLVRSGARPFETVYGISVRKLPTTRDYANSQIVPNIGLFGRPIRDGKVRVDCINRVIMHRVDYDLICGPVGLRCL